MLTGISVSFDATNKEEAECKGLGKLGAASSSHRATTRHGTEGEQACRCAPLLSVQRPIGIRESSCGSCRSPGEQSAAKASPDKEANHCNEAP